MVVLGSAISRTKRLPTRKPSAPSVIAFLAADGELMPKPTMMGTSLPCWRMRAMVAWVEEAGGVSEVVPGLSVWLPVTPR